MPNSMEYVASWLGAGALEMGFVKCNFGEIQ